MLRGMSDTLLRRGCEGDLPALVAIYNHYVRETAITFDVEPYTEEGRHVVVQVLRRVEPDLRSDRVRATAIDRIVRRVLGRDVLDRVRYARREAA